MYYDRYERRRLRQEHRLARRVARATATLPLNVLFPVDGLTGEALEAQIRKRAEIRLQRRTYFFRRLILYVLLNILLWSIWASAAPTIGGAAAFFPFPIIITIVWGIRIAVQGIQMYQDSGPGIERREERLEREIELEKMRLGLANEPYEKPKRDRAMRLSDDGELVPDDDAGDPLTKAKRS